MKSALYTRRKFLRDSLTALGVMVLPFPRSMFAHAAGPGKRQHLINLMDIGGWDTNYSFNFMDPALSSVLCKTPGGWKPLDKVRYGSGDFVTHPSGAKLSPGLKFWTPSDFQKTLIVRGLTPIAGHGQNQFIYSGGPSPYRAAHSAIVAGYQADTRGPSPLHYVKLTGGTREFSHSGMMTGNGIPSLVPSHESWKSLTTPRTGQLVGAALNDAQLIERGIADIGSASRARLNRNAAKGVVDGYMNGYSASVSLSNSDYARSPEFLSIWLRYFNALKQEAANQLSSGVGRVGDFANDGQLNNPHENQESFTSVFSGLVNYSSSNTAILTQSDGDTFVQWTRNTSWKYALTEFLIIKDLSAVVDLSPSGSDSHYNIVSAAAMHIIALAGARELIRGLSVTPNPDGSGSLLDCTLITYTSEFDREGPFGSDNSRDPYGTSHGWAFSMMMAGHRCQRGRVIGEVARGDRESDPQFKNAYGHPVAFDPNSGALGGSGMSAFSFLPSVLAIMGVPMPPQQVTDFKPTPVWIGG